MSRVLVRDTDFEHLRTAIDEVFEEFHVDLAGRSVLLKPNFGAAVGPEKSALTDPRVVKAVLDACLERTGDVVIGDNPGNLDTGAMHTIRMSGILELAGDFYANISQEGTFVDIGSAIIPRVFLSRKVLDVDYVINIPKMKTHVLCGLSCCIKNLYGYIVGAMKARYHLESKSLKRLAQFWLDLYRFRPPDLNIVDAIVAMEGGGPTHGHPRAVGKILAGTNGFEVDVVTTAMMGWDPRAIKKLEMAWEQGLGEIDVEKIDVVGDFEILAPFEKPPTFASIDPTFNPYEAITRIRPRLEEDRCVRCALCADESCPAGAISIVDIPVIDPNRCISCYCCVEFCPEGAWVVDYDKAVFEMA